MKFGKKKRGAQQDAHEKRQRVRNKIWEDPSIIEDLFNNKDWQAFDESPNQADIPSHKMERAIDQEIQKAQEQEQRQERRGARIRTISKYAVAASVLLLVTFNIWRWSNQPTQPDSDLLALQQSEVTAADSLWIRVVNNNTHSQTVSLPDSSTVKLFANSSIRYQRAFQADRREIHLEGKAFFDVEKDPSRPFSVLANETKTTALGTSFTIDSRANNSQTSIKLHSGKVVVASIAEIPSFENVFLDRPDEQLLFDAAARLVAHRGQAAPPETPAQPTKPSSKSASRLALTNIPLSEVFAALEDSYHCSINIADPGIAKIQYTGVIDPQSEKLADVLSVICLINDLRYEVQADGSYQIFTQQKTQENL